jgi:hypothetical protein
MGNGIADPHRKKLLHYFGNKQEQAFALWLSEA